MVCCDARGGAHASLVYSNAWREPPGDCQRRRGRVCCTAARRVQLSTMHDIAAERAAPCTATQERRPHATTQQHVQHPGVAVDKPGLVYSMCRCAVVPGHLHPNPLAHWGTQHAVACMQSCRSHQPKDSLAVAKSHRTSLASSCMRALPLHSCTTRAHKARGQHVTRAASMHDAAVQDASTHREHAWLAQKMLQAWRACIKSS